MPSSTAHEATQQDGRRIVPVRRRQASSRGASIPVEVRSGPTKRIARHVLLGARARQCRQSGVAAELALSRAAGPPAGRARPTRPSRHHGW